MLRLFAVDAGVSGEKNCIVQLADYLTENILAWVEADSGFLYYKSWETTTVRGSFGGLTGTGKPARMVNLNPADSEIELNAETLYLMMGPGHDHIICDFCDRVHSQSNGCRETVFVETRKTIQLDEYKELRLKADRWIDTECFYISEVRTVGVHQIFGPAIRQRRHVCCRDCEEALESIRARQESSGCLKKCKKCDFGGR